MKIQKKKIIIIGFLAVVATIFSWYANNTYYYCPTSYPCIGCGQTTIGGFPLYFHPPLISSILGVEPSECFLKPFGQLNLLIDFLFYFLIFLFLSNIRSILRIKRPDRDASMEHA